MLVVSFCDTLCRSKAVLAVVWCCVVLCCVVLCGVVWCCVVLCCVVSCCVVIFFFDCHVGCVFCSFLLAVLADLFFISITSLVVFFVVSQHLSF